MIIKQEVYNIDDIGRGNIRSDVFLQGFLYGSDYLYWLVQVMFTNLLLSHSLLILVYDDV